MISTVPEPFGDCSTGTGIIPTLRLSATKGPWQKSPKLPSDPTVPVVVAESDVARSEG